MKNLLYTLIVIIPLKLNSQELSLQVGTGIANYHGDLQQRRFTLKQAGPAGTLSIRLRILPDVFVRSGMYIMTLAGGNTMGGNHSTASGNTHFKSNLFEWSVTGGYAPELWPDGRFRPFISAGIGVIYFDPYLYDSKYVLPVKKSQVSEKMPPEHNYLFYNAVSMSIPLTGGVNYAISHLFGIGAEVGVRKTFSDHIDLIGEGSEKRKFTDWFYTLCISLYYQLRKPPSIRMLKCPRPPDRLY